MTDTKPRRHRLPTTIIQHAVRLHHRSPLGFSARAASVTTLGSYREVQELTYQCGIQTSHDGCVALIGTTAG